jgi:ribonuclease P/MRP protein subunit RPP1
VAIEICYAAGIDDTAARRNIISNAVGLIRGTRGRGLLISSEARRTVDLRGPFDVINLATFWGLKQEIGMGDGRKVLLHSDARRLTYKGAVQVVNQEIKDLEKMETERPKRKVTPVDVDEEIPPKGGKRRRGKRKAR